MSYIVVASFYEDAEVNLGGDLNRLLADERVRLLSREGESPLSGSHPTKVDIRGDHEAVRETTLYLASRVIEAGFVEFDIRHSM